MRSSVDALVAHHMVTAISAAVVAAMACTLVLVLNRLHGLVGLFLIVEKAGAVIEEQLMHRGREGDRWEPRAGSSETRIYTTVHARDRGGLR
ncbi:hypothetical protein [Sphaerisporangium fuscum]|uniref:hypothetical protein n=1 Tax=Sphaerisporangium fuscum TaxID=2835868 RepID=UPI001BDD02B3|nr:hypothetical protein [Sphaerisporangium fuscum]